MQCGGVQIEDLLQSRIGGVVTPTRLVHAKALEQGGPMSSLTAQSQPGPSSHLRLGQERRWIKSKDPSYEKEMRTPMGDTAW